MKLYSDKINASDVWQSLNGIEGVIVDDSNVRTFTSRQGVKALEFYLEGYGSRHVRARNGRDGKAATWDDWGVLIDRLFRIDPQANIGGYDGIEDFLGKTADWRGDHRAPWLDEDVAVPFAWPDDMQRAVDDAKASKKRTARVKQEVRALRAQADRLEATILT